MSTYLNKEFGASDYSKFRPTYPASLYDYLKQYRKSKSGDDKEINLAVDLACGTGQATKDLASFSKKVIGIDHSEVMVEQARKYLPGEQFEFKVGADTELSKMFPSESVGLLTVAEGAHWLKYPEFWTQAATVLEPGGTLAIWSYWTFSFPDYPEVANIVTNFAHADDKCGPYWNSGREILNNQYVYLRETIPEDQFGYIEYRINHFDELRPSEPFELVKRDVEVGGMVKLLKTWSPYFNYKKMNPDAPDIADEFMENVTKATGLKEADRVTVKWNTVLIFATKL